MRINGLGWFCEVTCKSEDEVQPFAFPSQSNWSCLLFVPFSTQVPTSPSHGQHRYLDCASISSIVSGVFTLSKKQFANRSHLSTMKIFLLVLMLLGILGLTNANPLLSLAEETKDVTAGCQANTSHPWDTYLAFRILPPMQGNPCNKSWVGSIHVALPPVSSTSSKCHRIYEYVTQYSISRQDSTMDVEWRWICPDDVHGTIPNPAKDPPNHPDTIVTIIAEPNFTAAEDRIMAMLNINDNINLQAQVMVGYDCEAIPPSTETLVTMNTIYCM